MKRREFLLRSASISAGILAMPSLLKSCTGLSPLAEVGIITNTVKVPIEKDWKTTLESLASYGYKYLEHGSTFGASVPEFLEFMKSIGMKSIAGGTSMAAMQKEEDLMNIINDCHELGKKYLVCYWPWMTSFDEVVRKDLDFVIAEFDRIGTRCREEGLRFAFHNHDKEFQEKEGVKIYDYFLENTDPEKLCMEADVYWMTKGGADPVEYFKKYPGRFELIHMKDMAAGPEKDFACVGSGIIDFQRIVDHSEPAGIKHLIVEHDNPEHHMECAKSSIEHILSLNL